MYTYISEGLMENNTALDIIKEIEDEISSLDEFPNRGAVRKVGVYGNKGYRLLFIKNFTTIYRVDEINKYIIIITIKYTQSKF